VLQSLLTNQAGDQHSVYHDRDFTEKPSAAFPEVAGVPFRRGEPFGEFNLGSTIVLVFEAPPQFEFKVTAGQTVKYGQPLGTVTQAHAA
jgi:phosphatidylserine decarboxylase